MKILIDECLPRKLKKEFFGYEVFTVPEMGWAGKKNGELLRLMTGEFDVFVTVDQNMQYQHSLGKIEIAFVVLVADSNKIESLAPLMPKVLAALQNLKPGNVIKVSQDQ